MKIIIPKYIKQDATLLNFFYLETALNVSGGTITDLQERKELYLQHLVFVTPLLLSAAIAAVSNGVSPLVSLLQVFGIKFVWIDYPSRGFWVSSPIRHVTNNWRRVDS